MATNIIYLKAEAVRAEARTSTRNERIYICYGGRAHSKQLNGNNWIAELLNRESVTAGAIKLALSRYSPINQLEYE